MTTIGAKDVPLLARELLVARNKSKVIPNTIKALRQKGRLGVVALLQDELIAHNCDIHSVYLERLAQLDYFLAGRVPLNRRVPLQRKLAFVLEKAIAFFDVNTLARRCIHWRLVRVSLELDNRELAMCVARKLFQRANDSRFSREIVRTIALLRDAGTPEGLLTLGERLFASAPADHEVALFYARRLRASGASPQKRFEVLQYALEQTPDHPGLLSSLARCVLSRDRVLSLESQAEKYAERLVQVSPTRESYAIYGRVLLLRGKRSEALAAFDKVTRRFDPANLGSIGEALSDLCALCNQNYYYQNRTNLDAFRKTLEQSRHRLDAFLASSETITADDLDFAARRLMGFNTFFLKFSRLVEVSGELGEQLGTLDPAPFSEIHSAISQHILTILEHGLSERILVRPIKGQGVIRSLASTYVSLSLSLGQFSGARKRLEELALAGLAENVSAALQSIRMFDEFEASGGFEQEFDIAGTHGSGELHRTAYWSKWTKAQDLQPCVMTKSPQREGCFSIVTAEGEVRQNKCFQQAFRLENVSAREIKLRDSELLIGPKGLLFETSPIHGNFPPLGLPSIVSNTRKSVCLRPATSSTRIEEPIVILANNNVARADSYGHWLIFILTRVNAVVESGLLTTRKLLMPAEMKPWMKETLGLIGVREDRILLYPKEMDIVACDAKVISPVDASTGDLFPKLRAKMYAAVPNHVSEQSRIAPFLYLARKTQIRRMMINEDQILRVAEKLGYSVVSPETLTVADQVRLFSQAKAIAGPGGSAFANMIFCQNGTRALCIKGEEKVSPLGLDLVVANGIDFRWLLGKSVQSLAQFTNPLDVPFEVDLGSLERHLAWAIEAAPA